MWCVQILRHGQWWNLPIGLADWRIIQGYGRRAREKGYQVRYFNLTTNEIKYTSAA